EHVVPRDERRNGFALNVRGFFVAEGGDRLDERRIESEREKSVLGRRISRRREGCVSHRAKGLVEKRAVSKDLSEPANLSRGIGVRLLHSHHAFSRRRQACEFDNGWRRR